MSSTFLRWTAAALVLGVAACDKAPKPPAVSVPEAPAAPVRADSSVVPAADPHPVAAAPAPQPYADEFARYYQDSRQAAIPRTDRKEIVAWTREKKRIGFLERGELPSKGTSPARRCSFIRDAEGKKDVGVVTEDGVFYRLDPKGEPIRLDRFPILTAGLKQFFGLSDGVRLDVEEVDPYK